MSKYKCSILKCQTTDQSHFENGEFCSFVPKYGIMYFGNKKYKDTLRFVCPKNKDKKSFKEYIPYSVSEFKEIYPELSSGGIICSKCLIEIVNNFILIDPKMRRFYIICHFCLEKKEMPCHPIFNPPVLSFKEESPHYLGDQLLEVYVPVKKLDPKNPFKLVEQLGGKIIKGQEEYPMCLDCICKNDEIFYITAKYGKKNLFPQTLKEFAEEN